jgi:hypothetical protein
MSVPAFALVLSLLLVLPGLPLARLWGPDAAPAAEGAGMPGQVEVKAWAEAWPDRIAETAFRDGEWMLRMDGQWFAWAEGRLVPEAERAEWQRYAPFPFYRYPAGIPPLSVVDEERAARIRARVREEAADPPRRHPAFLGALLQAADRAETESRMVRIEVAGYTVTVHERLAAPLAKVSEELWLLRESDPEVAAFLRGLAEMNGYNYRYVEGTRSRSLHSYGLAVDLVPRSYGGTHAYWMWAMSKVRDFWTVPYERRWMVPLPVVEAFERQGFTWGGKWLFFDTMHFEYRPEILLAAAKSPAQPSN